MTSIPTPQGGCDPQLRPPWGERCPNEPTLPHAFLVSCNNRTQIIVINGWFFLYVGFCKTYFLFASCSFLPVLRLERFVVRQGERCISFSVS